MTDNLGNYTTAIRTATPNNHIGHSDRTTKSYDINSDGYTIPNELQTL